MFKIGEKDGMNKQQMHDSGVWYISISCPHVYSAKFQLYLPASWLVNSVADLTTQHQGWSHLGCFEYNYKKSNDKNLYNQTPSSGLVISIVGKIWKSTKGHNLKSYWPLATNFSTAPSLS